MTRSRNEALTECQRLRDSRKNQESEIKQLLLSLETFGNDKDLAEKRVVSLEHDQCELRNSYEMVEELMSQRDKKVIEFESRMETSSDRERTLSADLSNTKTGAENMLAERAASHVREIEAFRQRLREAESQAQKGR